MKKHMVICAVGVALVGFVMPLVLMTSSSEDAALFTGYLWSAIVMPFTLYLGYISGKFFRKMWYYPLIYGVLPLGILFCCGDYLYVGNLGIFSGVAVTGIVFMLFWAWFYRGLPKNE